MRLLFLFFLITAFSKAGAQTFDTFRIYYKTGAYHLEEQYKLQLDSILQEGKPERILIYSYTDGTGDEKNNEDLSVRRAEEVRQYLLKHNAVTETNVPVCEGMGKDRSVLPGQDNAGSRRTDLFFRGIRKQAKKAVKPVVAAASFSDKNIRKLEVNQSLRLDNIIFFPGSAKVLPKSEGELNRLLQLMKDNPQLEVRLEGHVCCSIPPDGYKERSRSWILSEERAKTVLDYLTDNGIQSSRLSYAGFGRTRPVFEKEHTPEEQSANRRVEVRVLRK